MSFVVAALYQFETLSNLEAIKIDLFNLCQHNKIKGTLLLADEGINGTVSGNREGIDNLKAYLIENLKLNDMEYKESFADTQPFYRLKVRIKKEIVTLGRPEADPSQQVGQYVDPQQWNQLLQDPDVIVIDTRNDYEVEIGTFKGSINPNTKKFSEFPKFVEENLLKFKDKKIAMKCTGGIRCEKASAYMKTQGFKNVYHLKGGILKYLEIIPVEQSLWQGECFVFDNRVTVKHGLKVGDYELCHGCRFPISPEDKLTEHYHPGVSCARCHKATTAQQKQRFNERQKQTQLAKKRGQLHIGR